MRIHPLALGLLFFQTAIAGAVTAPLPGTGNDDPLLGHYDIRILGKAELSRVAAAYTAPPLRKAADTALAVAEPMRKGAEILRTAVPGLRVELSPVGSGVEVVSAGGVPLSPPAPGQDGASIVRGFLRDHAAVWGLSAEQVELHTESAAGGTRTVSLRQTVHGRPVFQSDTRALLDADGRLLQIVGRLVPGIDESTVPETMEISPAEALRSAMRSVGVTFDPAQTRRSRTLAGARQELDVESTLITRPVTTEAVYFPLAPGLVVPAWSQVTFTRGPSDWYTVVDARTGTVLWRKDIRYHVGELLTVYAYDEPTSSLPAKSLPAASPAPANQDNVSSCGPDQWPRLPNRTNVTAAANWIDPNLTKPTTKGKFADVYLDRNADDSADCSNSSGPCEEVRPGTFVDVYTPPPADGCKPDFGDLPSDKHYENGAMTQLFYLVNWFHDRLRVLGFVDRTFEDDDPVHAEAQYGAADDVKIFNLASFSAPPDGTPGILRLSLWNGPQDKPGNSPRDPSLDAEIVFHELAHGVTSRMIGNGACLNWFPGRALAEGWSDFYALALLNPDGAADGQYSFGSYTAYKLGGNDKFTDNYFYGMRRYPYAIKKDVNGVDMSVNPLTWSDTDDTTDCLNDNGADTCKMIPSILGWESLGANEIHNAGELWAASLWEMRAGIINTCGTSGNELALQLVTAALRGVPCEPGFIDARNALLAAVGGLQTSCDKAQIEEAIWKAFKRWGLGFDAKDSGGIATHYGIKPDLSDLSNNNSGVPVLSLEESLLRDINGDFVDAGDDARLKVQLRNPWFSREVNADVRLVCTKPDGSQIGPLTAQCGQVPARQVCSKEFDLGTLTLSAGSHLDCSLTVTDTAPPNPGSTFPLGLRTGHPAAAAEATITCKCDKTSCSPSQAQPQGFGTVTCGFETTGSPDCQKTAGGEKADCIPDGRPPGKVFTIEVADTGATGTLASDLDIDSLQLQIDTVTHPWVGDLTIMLKGPNGYGSDLVYRLANNPQTDDTPGTTQKPCDRVSSIQIPGLNRGNAFTSTKISDDAPADLFTVGCNAAPFTNDEHGLPTTWKPALQSSAWFSQLGEQKGPLSHFKGSPVQGTWQLFVSDVVPGGDDADLNGNMPGSLNSWSLIITPSAFSSGGNAAPSPIAGTQRALGDFKAGHMVSYKLVLINPGEGKLPDGSGPEFQEVLPSELALVAKSVRASRGRASVTGNTVIWNGSLPPGGSVQLDFDARIRPGTAGKTVSSQGMLRYVDGGKGLAEAMTDDPTTSERGDANRFVVAPPDR